MLDLANGHDLVIHCAGPFQYLPLNPLTAAMEAGRNYIDLSEGREFHRRVIALLPRIQQADSIVATGMSIVPAMQAILVQTARPLFDRLTSIRTFLAPSTRRSRGPAMFHTMLMGVGASFPLHRAAREEWLRGWSEGEWAHFPPPVGARLTYHVLDWADSDVLVDLFGVDTVECKAGSEFAWVNRALSVAAGVRGRYGRPVWERWTGPMRALSWVLGRAGRDDGGVLIEVSGKRDGRSVTHRIAVVASVHGGRIPVMPAAMAAHDMLDGRLDNRGLVRVDAWISPEYFVARLRQRGLKVVWKPHGSNEWQEHLPLPPTEMQCP